MRKPDNKFTIPYKYTKRKSDKVYTTAGAKITKSESEAEKVRREGRA